MQLLLIFLMATGYLILDTTKEDKDTVQSLIENATDQRAEIRESQERVLGELSGLALFLTGQKSFNGHDVEKYPPQQYIIECDSCADKIPAGGYDSCKVGIIRDTSMTRAPWYCYGSGDITEFR